MADPATVAAFERACCDAQHPNTRLEAERALAHLTARPDALSVALAVAVATTFPVARFHAAHTIRSAALLQWPTLPSHYRHGPSSLRNRLVAHAIAHPALSTLERRALLRAAATLALRAYLEEPPAHRATFFQTACATTADPPTPQAATAAAELLDYLLDDFITPTVPAAAPALHRELLVQTRACFLSPTDGHVIPLLFSVTSALSRLLVNPAAPGPGNPDFETSALPALSAVFRVLAADPAHPVLSQDTAADIAALDATVGETLEPIVITAFQSSDWAAVIAHVPTILRICLYITRNHAALARGPDPNDLPETIARASQLVQAVAAISRRSYQNVDAARAVLQAVMDGVHEQQWAASPAGVIRLAHAEVWRRVSCAHGLTSLEQLGPGYFPAFTKDTCDELENASLRLARPDAEDNAFSMDVADMLLETWANLALQGDDGCPSSKHPLEEEIRRVVYHFTRMSLRSTGDVAKHYTGANVGDTEEDFGFEDSSIADSRLAVAAILTRFVLGKMASAIAQSLLIAAEKVFHWSDPVTGSSVQPHHHREQQQASGLPLDLYQEDLFFLIRFAAALLADEAKGEHPTVPVQFVPHAASNATANGHDRGVQNPSPHAQVLLTALFNVSEQETRMLDNRGVHCEEASPRVGSAILLALSRVTRTYLAPVCRPSNDSLSPSAAIGSAMVISGRAGCFIKAIEGISRRGFEADVADAAATLLSSLAAGTSQHPDIREAPAWQTLLNAGAEAYQTLPAGAVQRIGKALTTVLGDVVAQRLLVPAYNSLQKFANDRDRVAESADKAIAIVNLLRGAAQCESMGPRTRETLLVSLQAPGGVAAACAKSFGRSRPDVVRSLIKLADDIVSSSLPLLSDQESSCLLTNVVTIVKLHADIVATFITEASEDDLSEDVEEILSLMSRILDEETEIDVGEACYYGLSTILPIMSDTMLALPSVNAKFFRFTTRLVSHHPKKLVLLHQDFCSKILQTIDLQRESVEIGSERRSLEAIASLARARVLEREEGPSSSVVDAALLRFLRAIFDGIASGSAHTSNLDAASDALLPLIYIKHEEQRSAFEELGQALLSSSGHSMTMRAAVQELGQAASQAGSAHGFHSEGSAFPNSAAERAARLQASKSFREAVANFSRAARKCLISIAIGSASA